MSSFDPLFEMRTIPDDWDQFYAVAAEQYQGALGRFYQCLASPEQLISQTEFVALDLETTGLNPLTDEIVSLGLIPFRTGRIRLSDAKYWLVKPSSLSVESIKIHGITHQQISSARLLSQVIDEVIEYLTGRQIVVHYHFMEREFLRAFMARHFKQHLLFPVVDTLELEAQKLRDERRLHQKILGKRLPSVRLLNARQRYNLPAYENHNALTDALATAELLIAQIARLELDDQPTRALWV